MDEVWYGSQIDVNSDPLFDPGKGKEVVLRTFEFQANPENKVTPTEQQLFDAHWPQIQNQLFKDGFVPLWNIQPRFTLSADKQKYFFIIACEANTLVLEKPRTLNDVLK